MAKKELICAENEVEWWVHKTDTISASLGISKCVDASLKAYYEDGSNKNYGNKIVDIAADTTTWNFSLLPTGMREEIKKLLDDKNEKALLEIQNKYLLSGSTICCDTNNVVHQFKNAIDNNLINE
mgnify:FL=1